MAQVNGVARVVDFLCKKEEPQVGQLADLAGKNLEFTQSEIKRYEIDQRDSIKKQREAEDAEKAWGLWNAGIQYVGAAASVGTGAVVFAAGGIVPGAVLMGNGAAILTNRVISDLGGYKAMAAWVTDSRDQQRKFSESIDTSVTFTTTGISLFTGWGARAFFEPQGLNTVLNVVQKSTAVLNGLTRVGTAKAQQRTQETQKDLMMTSTHTTILHQRLIDAPQELGELLEPTRQIAQVAKSAIQAQ